MPNSDEPFRRVPAPYDPELSRLANALADLAPRVRPFDRDTLMFRAGQASVPRTGWTWPLVASLSSFLAIVFGAAVALRAAPGPAFQYVAAPAPPPRQLLLPPLSEQPPAAFEETPLAAPYGSASEPPLPRHLQMHEQLLRWGLDGLPPAPPAPAQPHPESIDRLLRSL
jgi:hypothetical protein